MTETPIAQVTEVQLKKPVWGGWATAGLGFAVLVTFISIQLFTVVIFSTALVFSNSRPDFPQIVETMFSIGGLITAMATLLSAFACTGLIIAFIRLRGGLSSMEYLSLKPISKRTILLLLAISLGYVVISESITVMVGKPIVSLAMVQVYNTSVWPFLLWMALIIFGPAFEEVFFRGFLFEGFRQSRLGVVGATVITAATWAFIHYRYELYVITVIFVLGILLGAVRYKTGSLWSVFIIHAFYNLAAMVETVLYINGVIG